MDEPTDYGAPSDPVPEPPEFEQPAAAGPDFHAFDAPATETPKRHTRGKGSQNVRRPVERALAVDHLPAKVRLLLGKSLGLGIGASTDVAEVAVESLEKERQAKSTIAALVSLAESDAMEAGVTATGLASDRAEFKKVWGLASELDENLPAVIPSTQAKAGLALARAAQGLDPGAMGLLAKALAVLNNDY